MGESAVSAVLVPGRISSLLCTSFALIGHRFSASCAPAGRGPGKEAPRVQGQPGMLGGVPGGDPRAGRGQAAPPV